MDLKIRIKMNCQQIYIVIKGNCSKSSLKKKRTASSARAYGRIGRVLGRSANVADACVEQALVGVWLVAAKGLAVDVLDAPEAAGGDGGLLGVGGDGNIVTCCCRAAAVG